MPPQTAAGNSNGKGAQPGNISAVHGTDLSTNRGQTAAAAYLAADGCRRSVDPQAIGVIIAASSTPRADVGICCTVHRSYEGARVNEAPIRRFEPPPRAASSMAARCLTPRLTATTGQLVVRDQLRQQRVVDVSERCGCIHDSLFDLGSQARYARDLVHACRSQHRGQLRLRS